MADIDILLNSPSVGQHVFDTTRSRSAPLLYSQLVRLFIIIYKTEFLKSPPENAVASTIITIRASQSSGHNLCRDMAALQFPCIAGFGIVVLSWIVTLLSKPIYVAFPS